MSHKTKGSGSQKKFVCIFDTSHFVESEQKLVTHMRKCKAMQKASYLCCKYNGLHWVKHDQIDQHQESCQDKNKLNNRVEQFTKILPDQISQYSMAFEIDMSMIQSSERQPKKNPKIESQKYQNEDFTYKKSKETFQKPKKAQMWKQPCFQDYLKKKGYKQKTIIRSMDQNQSFIGNNQSFFL